MPRRHKYQRIPSEPTYRDTFVLCQRCGSCKARVQAWDRETNASKALCPPCVAADPVLKRLPVKRKTLLDRIEPSERCERCEVSESVIRAVFRDVGEVAFLCRRCVDVDPQLRDRPIRPKV